MLEGHLLLSVIQRSHGTEKYYIFIKLAKYRFSIILSSLVTGNLKNYSERHLAPRKKIRASQFVGGLQNDVRDKYLHSWLTLFNQLRHLLGRVWKNWFYLFTLYILKVLNQNGGIPSFNITQLGNTIFKASPKIQFWFFGT